MGRSGSNRQKSRTARSSSAKAYLSRWVSSKAGKWTLGALSTFVLSLIAALSAPVRDRVVHLFYGDKLNVSVRSMVAVDVGEPFELKPTLSPKRLSKAQSGIAEVKYDMAHLHA